MALRRFLKDTIIYGLATVVPRLMNFVLVPLHTSVLNTDRYARNTEFFVWAAFFNVLLTYGMETAFFRFFSRSDEPKKTFATTAIALGVTTIIFGVLAFLFLPQLAAMLDMRIDFLRILLGVLIMDTLVVAPFAYLRATNRPVRFAAIKIFNILTVVVVNFYFLWYLHEQPVDPAWYDRNNLNLYVFLATLAASAVTLLLLMPQFKYLSAGFSWRLLKPMLAYGWPIMVGGLAFVVNENLDKLMLNDLIGEDTMGAYSGCYKLAVFMTIFIQAFRMGAEPFFFSHAKEQNAPETYARILKYFVIAGCLVFLGILANLSWLKDLIIKQDEYFMALSIVPIILLANLFLGIYHNLAVWYKLTDRTHWGMYLSIFGAVLTIAINWYGIPRFGFIASAWATLAAYGSMMLLSYFLGKRHYPVPYPIARIGLYLSLAIGTGWLLFSRFTAVMLPREGFDNKISPFRDLSAGVESEYQLLLGWIAIAVFAGIVVLMERKDLRELK